MRAFCVCIFALMSAAVARVQCVEPFDYDRARFDVCKRHLCLLIVREEPGVRLGAAFSTNADVYPFRLHDRAMFPGLRGSFLSIARQVEALADAYLIWGGPRCGHDSMVRWVSKRWYILGPL